MKIVLLEYVMLVTHLSAHRTQCLNRARTGHGKPGKSWNSLISFSRPGKSWNLGVGHGKSWKISTLSMSERQ